jgi:pyrroline-5-carboxylate reductase
MKKIGIIGFGNMGSTIGEQVQKIYRVFIFDKDKEKTKKAEGRNIQVVDSVASLVEQSDVVIMAVKPQDFDDALNEIKSCRNLADKLFISIAAGIDTSYIEKTLGNVRVVRVMPNMAIKIGQGISCLSKGKLATKEDFDATEKIFGYMGKTLRIEEEKMSLATAVSGSGPGFYFDIVESILAGNKSPEKFTEEFIIALTKAAEERGFKHEEAVFLATGTGTACQLLLVKTKLEPSELKRQITSKGGTTAAGLAKLQGSIEYLGEAVEAAKRRAEELSKG